MPAAFLVVVACCIGCGGSAESTLTGKWEIDKDYLKEQVEKEGKGDAGAAFAAGMMDSMNMSFDFQSGGKFVMSMSFMGQSESDEGTWKVTKSDGDKLTVEVENEERGKEELTVTVVDKDTIELSGGSMSDAKKMPGSGKLRLKRAK